MPNIAVPKWTRKYVTVGLRTTENPAFDKKLTQLSDALSEIGYTDFHRATKQFFNFNGSTLVSNSSESWCFRNEEKDNVFIVSPSSIEFATRSIADVDEITKKFSSLKNSISDVVNFFRIKGISTRVIYGQDISSFPESTVNKEYCGLLWNAPGSQHVHSEFKHWEDINGDDLPGRITLTLKTVKGHGVKAEGEDFFEQQLFKIEGNNTTKSEGGFICDCYESSNDFKEIPLTNDVSSLFIKQFERVTNYVSAVHS